MRPTLKFNSHDFSYYVSFIDYCTRMGWIYFQVLTHKSKVFDVFVSFYIMIWSQFRTQVRRLDNGGDYITLDMKQYFSYHGLVHQTTSPESWYLSTKCCWTKKLNSSSNCRDNYVRSSICPKPLPLFGSTVHVHLPRSSRNDMKPQAVKYEFMGYRVNQERYHFIDQTRKLLLPT